MDGIFGSTGERVKKKNGDWFPCCELVSRRHNWMNGSFRGKNIFGAWCWTTKLDNFGKNVFGNSVFFSRKSNFHIILEVEFCSETNNFVQNWFIFRISSWTFNKKSARAHLIDHIKCRSDTICIYFSRKPYLHPNKTAFSYVHQALLLSIIWQMYFEQKNCRKSLAEKKCADFRCVHGIFHNRNDVLKR